MTEKEDVVVFCDLGNSGVVKCDDVVKRQTWVDDQFDLLLDRSYWTIMTHLPILDGVRF